MQTVFYAGNSLVVSIPKPIIEELGIKPGQTVRVEKLGDGGEIVVKTEITKKKKKKLTASDKEFAKWLDKFLKEDAALLDELATR